MSERTPQRRRPQARPPAAGVAPSVGLSLPAASGKGILERDPRCLIASPVETCPRPGSASDSLRKHQARCERGSYDLFPLRMKNSEWTSSFASGSQYYDDSALRCESRSDGIFAKDRSKSLSDCDQFVGAARHWLRCCQAQRRANISSYAE